MPPQEAFNGTERFEVRRRLGGGAFGVVYEVFDRQRESTVALKLLRQADSAPLYLFKQEFRNLANLVHQNLVTLYELQADGDQWFFTMELVEGIDFQRYVASQQSPIRADTTTILGLPTADSAPTNLPSEQVPTSILTDTGSSMSSDPTSDIQIFIRSGNNHTGSSSPTVDSLGELISEAPTVDSLSGLIAENPTVDSFSEPISEAPTVDSLEGLSEAPTVHSLEFTSETPTVDSSAFALNRTGMGKKTAPTQVTVTQLAYTFNEARLREGMRQLVAGVNALHEVGKLHRDLKPSNVLVTPEGRVVILDFGLVAELKEYADPGNREIIGTPAYMSPEQAVGNELTPASDMYSIGVMLYEALTGRLVFTGDVYTIIRRKYHEDFLPPKMLVSKIPDDLNTLCCELLNRDPKQRPTAKEVLHRLNRLEVTAASPPPAPSRTRTTRPEDDSGGIPLVGRAHHLKHLQEAFELSRQEPVVATVHGHSGMGKSVLVDCFLGDLKKQAPTPIVLSGRCYEQESVPYKAFDSIVDVLSRRLKHLWGKEHQPEFPTDLPVLAKLFPVLRQLAPIAEASQTIDIPDSQELRRRAFGALRAVLSQLAALAPLVIHIDDLQWGDVDSATLLMELVRPPDPPPMFLIAGYRSEEAETSPFLNIFLPKLQDKTLIAAQVREVRVGELSLDEARKLVQAILGNDPNSADRVEAIIRESAGSPFFVNELARYAQNHSISLVGTGARDTLDAVIRERVSQLPEIARRILEVAAVAGQPVGRLVVKRVAEAGADEQASVILLRSQHLIRVRRAHHMEEIEPYHDRIREAVEHGLDADQLKSHHYRLAVELEAFGHADPETLAVHYRDGGDRPKAAHYALVAAEQAETATAFDRAVRLYRLALELRDETADHRQLLVKLGNALANAGRGAEAAETYLKASDLTSTGLSTETALELRRRAAEQFLNSGHIEKGLTYTDQVLKAVGLRLAPTPRHAMASLILRRIWLMIRGFGFTERTEAEVPPEELIRLDICWSVAAGLVFVDNIRSAEFQTRYLLFALKAGEPFRIARGLNLFTGGSSVTGGRSLARTQKLLAAAISMADRVQHPYTSGMVKVTAGLVAFYNGGWKESIELLDQGEEILRARCTGVTWELNTSRYYALRAMFFLGDLRQLNRESAALVQDARERGDVYALAGLRLRGGYLSYLILDNVEQARLEAEEGIRQWTSQGHHIQHFFYLAAQVEIELYVGNGIKAWDMLAARWKAFSKSLLFRVQTLLIEFHFLRARSGLSAFGQETDIKRQTLYLKQAEADAQRIEKEHMEWCQGIPEVIRAGIAACEGRRDDAIRLLTDAETNFQNANMWLHSTAARYRRGQLLGGSKGKTLMESARVWMNEQEIKSPEHTVDMLIPGIKPR